jgi:hypothetical protein
MHRVTIEWIQGNKTKAGGFKREQLAAIGVTWPPKQGWPARCAGKWITDEQKAKFESFAGPKVNITGVFQPSCLCNVLPWEDCEHTTSLFDHVQDH